MLPSLKTVIGIVKNLGTNWKITNSSSNNDLKLCNSGPKEKLLLLKLLILDFRAIYYLNSEFKIYLY